MKYSSRPYLWGDTFQDAQWMPEVTDPIYTIFLYMCIITFNF